MGSTSYKNCTNNIARKEISKLLSFLLKLVSFYSLKDKNALIPKISLLYLIVIAQDVILASSVKPATISKLELMNTLELIKI